MMNELSPITRKFVAITLLFFALLLFGTVLILPLWERMSNSIEALADTRYQLEKLEVMRNSPPLPRGKILRKGSLIAAKRHEQAEAILAAKVQNITLLSGNITKSIRPLGQGAIGSVVAIEISVEGDEQALIGLIEQIENAEPLMRLRSWQIEPVVMPTSSASLASPDVSLLASSDLLAEHSRKLRLAAVIVAVWEVR